MYRSMYTVLSFGYYRNSWKSYIIFSLTAHLNVLSFICDAFYYVLTASFYADTEKREGRAREKIGNEKAEWKIESS